MVQRERVTEDVFVFTSDLYVQVTAGVIVTTEGAVVVDTLLYPEETQQIKRFIEERLRLPILYVVNTHHHADHTMGNSILNARHVVGHRLCRDYLDTRTRQSLARSQADSPDFAGVRIMLPDMVFDAQYRLPVGNKTLVLQHMPGHSADSITCLIEEEGVLFAGDTVMSIPHFVDGDYDALLQSLQNLKGQTYEHILQGHGEIILRGEIEERLEEDIVYLRKLYAAVEKVLATTSKEADQKRALTLIKVSACGKSHVLLNGDVEHLHQQNVFALAQRLREKMLAQSNSLD